MTKKIIKRFHFDKMSMKKNKFKLTYHSKMNSILFPENNKIKKNKSKNLEKTYNFHFSR